jgi:hypothetical protein
MGFVCVYACFTCHCQAGPAYPPHVIEAPVAHDDIAQYPAASAQLGGWSYVRIRGVVVRARPLSVSSSVSYSITPQYRLRILDPHDVGCTHSSVWIVS